MTIVFDTAGYSELVRGHPDAAKALKEANTVIMPLPTIAELRSGFAFGTKQAENEAQLTRFLAANKTTIAYPNDITAEYYVAALTHARQKGKQLSHNDLWIAALAIQHNAVVVSSDADFMGLKGLTGFRVQLLKLGID